jgi:hypothetical protein
MANSIPAEPLEQSVGAPVKNHLDKTLGKIIEVTYNYTSQQPEYLIIKSNQFHGSEDRFFAIPTASAQVTLTEENKIVLKVIQNDLELAKRIPANQCPSPDMQFAQPMYELYQYEEPDNQKFKSNNQS